MSNLVKWCDFSEKGDDRGLLSIVEANKDIPFDIARVYYIYATKQGVARGLHAHRELNQVLVAVSGRCVVKLEDADSQDFVTLDARNKGLFLRPWVWHEMRDFTEDCVLLCLADAHYDEADYIRDYHEFKRLVAGQ